MLQRGRARVSAEFKSVISFRFRDSLLQRGRARVSAELSLPTHCVRWKKEASTGPRSCERGIIGDDMDFHLTDCWLQRGRARVSAELKRRKSRRRTLNRFNGAALV